ncbi:MAG: hypothetical protein ACPHK8_03700 [Thermoplasmatota archaeon]
MSDITSSLIVLTVGLVSLGLAVMGALGAKKTGDNRLWFVAGAFSVFAIKGLLTSFALLTESIGHETLETLGAMMELVAVVLLVLPFART